MKMSFVMLTAMFLFASLAQSGTFPGSISREPLMRGNVSDRLSIGLGYDRIQRDVKLDGDPVTRELQAHSISGYVGYDALSWLTTFITVGGTALRGGDGSEDYALRLSLGLNAYIWEGDVLAPAFAAGRISIKGTAEVLRHEIDVAAGKGDWIEVVAALPIGYEFFDRYPASRSGVSTSLALYAGPAVSFLDGDVPVAPGRKQGFRENQVMGAVAGADIFFAPAISIGFKALIFDQVSTGASLRFHF